MVDRFGKRNSPRIVEQVASALANVGTALFRSGRLEEGAHHVRWSRAELQGNDSPILREVVARSFANRGNVLAALQRETEALSSWEEAVRRFEAGGLPDVAEPFATR